MDGRLVPYGAIFRSFLQVQLIRKFGVQNKGVHLGAVTAPQMQNWNWSRSICNPGRGEGGGGGGNRKKKVAYIEMQKGRNYKKPH